MLSYPRGKQPRVDESFARLHRAGWSVGDVGVLTAEGPVWCVGGTNAKKLASRSSPSSSSSRTMSMLAWV
jgi:hypothetical protein